MEAAMGSIVWFPLLALVAGLSPALAADTLSPAEQQAAFKAAGFIQRAGQWRACDDPGTVSYSPGRIAQVADLNGDGEPEAVIEEGSTFCYGMAGSGFAVVSRQAGGGWRRITGGAGMPLFLATRGAGGWPDLQVGGPGFCFPVQRWNGREYKLNRFEYEGKRCKPPH
jgi:hypothetical protein